MKTTNRVRKVDETLDAMADARKRGVGFLRILRITTEQYRVTRLDPALVVVLDDPVAYLDRLLAAIYALPCSYCHADAGDRCRTSSDRVASYPHGARSRPVYDAWRLGHRDGLVDALRRLVKDWETPAEELLRKHEVTW